MRGWANPSIHTSTQVVMEAVDLCLKHITCGSRGSPIKRKCDEIEIPRYHLVSDLPEVPQLGAEGQDWDPGACDFNPMPGEEGTGPVCSKAGRDRT